MLRKTSVVITTICAPRLIEVSPVNWVPVKVVLPAIVIVNFLFVVISKLNDVVFAIQKILMLAYVRNLLKILLMKICLD